MRIAGPKHAPDVLRSEQVEYRRWQHFAVRGYVTPSISYSHYASSPPVPYFHEGALLEVYPGHDIQQISRLR
jgi:hypothetical protein